MSDISDDEIIEKKPKRVMSEKQKQALATGRALAKANRLAQKVEVPKQEKQAEEPQPEKKKKEKKVKEVKEVVNEVVEAPKGQRISRKPKTREPSPEPEPERSPSPEPVKKTRTPRKKAEKAEVEMPSAPKLVRATKPALQFV